VPFEELVAEALDSIPEELSRMMSNVEIVVQDEPAPHQLANLALGPDSTLFGLYEGIPLTSRGVYDRALPDKITIFEGPITRYARTPDAIREQVRRTVIHEVAHHFGIDEDRLHDLGWG
jgi:predicted Zn-dependent protease with MMP-like domain